MYQRFMRRPGTPPEIFIWTPDLSKQEGFEEVWANDAKEAETAPAAAHLDSVGRADLKHMSKRELACWAAFRLSLELDPGKMDKPEIIKAICDSQGWEMVDLTEQAQALPQPAATGPETRVVALDHREAVDAVQGAAAAVANSSVSGGEAAVLMMIESGFVPADPFKMARAIDDRALEILSEKPKDPAKTGASSDSAGTADTKQSGVSDAGKSADGAGSS